MSYKLLLVLTFALCFSASAAPSAFDTPEMKRAAKIVLDCGVRNVRALDDHISPANVIAEALTRTCHTEIDYYAQMLTITNDEGPEYKLGVLKGMNTGNIYLTTVLGYRTGTIHPPK